MQEKKELIPPLKQPQQYFQYYNNILVFLDAVDKYFHPKILLFLRDDAHPMMTAIILFQGGIICTNFYSLSNFTSGFNFT